MEHTISPHVLERSQAVVTVPAEPGRALLVLPNDPAAAAFGASVGAEPRAVTSEEISEACERHGLALVGLYGFLETGDLSIVQAELVSEIFEEVSNA